MGDRQRQITEKMSLKEKVKGILADNDMTMQQLADSIGVTTSALFLLLKKGNPSLNKLEKIANALGVPVAALVDEEFEEERGVTCPYCGKQIKFTAEKV